MNEMHEPKPIYWKVTLNSKYNDHRVTRLIGVVANDVDAAVESIRAYVPPELTIISVNHVGPVDVMDIDVPSKASADEEAL